MPSSHLILCRPLLLPASESFPMSQLFAWGGQSTGVSASASFLPKNTQDWSPLGWTGWISLQSKGPSRVFSSTTVQKHQFFGAQPSSQWITTNCGKFLKRREYQTTWPAFWEICMQVRKQQLELDLEQQTGSKLGKEYVKAVYCHPAYLTSMQSTSWETLGWMKHKLESRLPGEISITSDTQMTPPLWQKVKKN